MNHSKDNKRIARNAGMLYIRMAIIMLVGFYTTRVLLENLGIDDYGIYNVVGGVIALIGVITSSISGSIQRYITYEIGLKDKGDVSKVFSTAIVIQLFFSIILIILAETIGLWFLKNEMVIPAQQEFAAFWVYQSSILSIIISLFSIPYMSMIIANEEMNIFAYISVVEAGLKLLIVFAIAWLPFNRLICYSFLVVIVQGIIRICYVKYCKCHYSDTKFKLRFEKKLIKEIGGFAGWSTFGSFAFVLSTQGINILLNVFFGPVVNAARGIAVQVQAAVQQFSTSFQTAINPQITKSFASEDINYLETLVCNSSRYSFYLIFLVSLPILVCTYPLLSLWLTEIPEYTCLFVQLIIGIVMLTTISNPMTTAAMATGRIKHYQICVGGILLLIVPSSYILLKLGYNAYSVFIIYLILEFIAHFVRLFFLKYLIGFRVCIFLTKVWLPIIKVGSLSYLMIRVFQELVSYNGIVDCVACIFLTIILISNFGMSKRERALIKNKFWKKNYAA